MRVLIVRTSALGDVVHALPVLTALRRQLPEARIGWVVEEGMAPLLAGHPDLDELFVVRLRQWRKVSRRGLAELGGFVSELRRFAADVALDLMGNHKAGAISRLSGARTRIGFARLYEGFMSRLSLYLSGAVTSREIPRNQRLVWGESAY